MKKLILLLILAAGMNVSSAWAQTQPPNIVIIVADDLGYGDVGFNGVQDIPTPNIDLLAADGVRCTDGYVTEPFCAPSRAAILTGRYQERFGFDSGPPPGSDNPLLGLPLTELTLPQLLKPAGYVCGAIGKWHLGFASGLFPLKRGFDEFVGFLDAQSDYYDAYLYRQDTRYREPEYLTDAFTREAVSFINNHASQPFFLYLAYNAVHAPYDTPPDQYMQRVSYITDPHRQVYAAMVAALDDGVGQVVETLQANNILNNTLIFFLSDNGAPLKDFDATALSNYPLRGYKLDVLEGGIRVPFAVQWPARLPANAVYRNMVSSLDIFATASAAAGVALPTDRAYDGLNIVPYLAGEQVSPDRTLFWRWFGLGPDGPLGALNTIRAVRNGSFKLVVERDKDTQPPALYDLSADIGETENLSGSSPAEVASLQNLYNQWELDAVPALWQKHSDPRLLPLVMAGDWNGFNKDDLNPPWSLTRITAPDAQGTPDAYNWLISTIHVATNGGDTTPGTHTFTLVGARNYSTQWGGATINIDTITRIPSFSGQGLGPSNTISFDDGFYYSLRLIDTNDQPNPHRSMTLAVMKTSSPPVSVSRTGQTPEHPTPADPIIVSIATSKPKSPEERIYLRWSNDWFITSHMVEAEGSDLSYTATIPPQAAGSSVLYTVLTSTADLTLYSGSGIIDELTLAMNGVFNAVPPTPVTTLNLESAASVFTQGTQSFAVPLPLAGEPGVECRSGGGRYTLVFTFSEDVVSGSASLTSGSGRIAGSAGFAGRTMTVNLAKVTDVQRITLTLMNVTSSSSEILPDTDVSMNVLGGDVDGNKIVDSADASLTRSQVGMPLTESNFREDVKSDGVIDNKDGKTVTRAIGHSLP